MNYDFALVTLNTPATSGYLSLYYPSGTQGGANPGLTTAGYPGSKTTGTMWRSACGNTSIDYSSNNAFANVAQCAGGVSDKAVTLFHTKSSGVDSIPSDMIVGHDTSHIRKRLAGGKP